MCYTRFLCFNYVHYCYLDQFHCFLDPRLAICLAIVNITICIIASIGILLLLIALGLFLSLIGFVTISVAIYVAFINRIILIAESHFWAR